MAFLHKTEIPSEHIVAQMGLFFSVPNGTVPFVTLLEFCVLGNVLEKCVFTCVVVHADTVVFESVADYQIVYVENYIVAGYLIKDLLGDGYSGSFVFYYYFGLACFVVDY